MGAVAHRGSIAAGMSTMLMLGILLSWVPGLGTLIAGIVGGRLAGGLRAALIASVVPSLVLGTLLFMSAPLFAQLPIIGVLAAIGGMTLATTQIIALIVGAAIGGVLS